MLQSFIMNRQSTVHSPTFSPLYRQIRGLITRSLESGEWGPGDMIPSESDLAVRFGVSQGTVRKAIDEMAAAFVALAEMEDHDLWPLIVGKRPCADPVQSEVVAMLRNVRKK